VYREPGPDGYARAQTLLRHHHTAAHAFPVLVLRVVVLLPPPGMERFLQPVADRLADLGVSHRKRRRRLEEHTEAAHVRLGVPEAQLAAFEARARSCVCFPDACAAQPAGAGG
jgi:hypothetical protein